MAGFGTVTGGLLAGFVGRYVGRWETVPGW